jgi:stage II sporulation protein AA (anti-sigma F factor antagonist)
MVTIHAKVRAGRPAMPLEITQREMKGIYLLALKGRLALGQESTGLRTVIDGLLANGATRIVLNLEHVHFVDSAGLGALIELHRKTKTKGGRLLLCHLGPQLKQALELARLMPLFETSQTEQEAIASF